MENKNLDSYQSVSCMCFDKTVINIRTQCVQWDATFPIPFRARHFRAA